MNIHILLNMDFNDVVTVLGDVQAWVTSPGDGVSRNHLERNALNRTGYSRGCFV